MDDSVDVWAGENGNAGRERGVNAEVAHLADGAALQWSAEGKVVERVEFWFRATWQRY